MNPYSMLRFWLFFALIFCLACIAMGLAFVLTDRQQAGAGIGMIFVGLVALITGNIAVQVSTILNSQIARIEKLEKQLSEAH